MKAIKLESVGESPMMTVRRLPGGFPQFTYQWQGQEFPLSVDPSEGIGLGDGLLVLDATCGEVPATQENVAAARLGAGEGWDTPRDTFRLPFGAPDVPKVDVH